MNSNTNTSIFILNVSFTFTNTISVDFSKMITDTRLKFSTCTIISTSYPMIYHTLLWLKVL